MSFATVPFLYILLPLTLIIYFLSGFEGKIKYKNSILLVASVIFYAWCGIQYLILFAALILINYYSAKKIASSSKKKVWFIGFLCVDVGVLAVFKYFNFFVDNIERLVRVISKTDYVINEPLVPLPLGISFIVFQLIAFLADVYRDEIKVENIWDVALFFMFFPQVLQGPILRYKDISSDIKLRAVDKEQLNRGVERFMIGFVKKLLIADKLVPLSNQIFSLAETGITMGYAWLGIISYAFIIYFDFSGYTDMAIGLAQIFGFRIPENFEHPYIAQSIKEFWNRWHITLSTWFRDYIYIPLGGNRRGKKVAYRNLLIVFLLTGIWHGASWTFIIWGLWHGVFRLLEAAGLDKILKKVPVFVRYLYTWLVVLVGWVFFRAESVSQAFGFVKAMFIPNEVSYLQLSILKNINLQTIVVLVFAFLFSMPIRGKIVEYMKETKLIYLYRAVLCCLFVVAMASMLGSSVSPSIYEKF